MEKSLVLLSGGQDSTTCLYWALDRFGQQNVETIAFNYGQRHRVELACAAKVAEIAEVPHLLLPIDTFAALGGNALTDEKVAVQNQRDATTHLPNTFVPGRNLIFLTFASAHAYARKIHHLVTGVAQTDYSGYPDCRNETIRAVEKSIQLGMAYDVTIHTPLMFKTKAETVTMATALGAMEAMAFTHTCYHGQQPPCGACPACQLRAQGFAKVGMPDPLVARFRKVPYV